MKSNSSQSTLLVLQKLKVDCLYKKSTHFNAARRLKSSGNKFKIALIVGTILASFSTIMNVGLWDKIYPESEVRVLELIINILGAAGGFLMLYTTTFSDYNTKVDASIKHESIANDINLIFKRIRNTEAAFKDKIIDVSRLVEELNKYTDDFVAKCQNAPVTNDEDFKKARKNQKSGYTSEYTEDELNA
jgi:hypothetical protein